MNKITILKGASAFAFAVSLALSGCEKSNTSPTRSKFHEKTPALTLRCTPDRSVVGYTALCDELDALTNCDPQACTGGSVTMPLTQYLLTNSSGSIFVFASNQTITTTQQSEVMAAAKARAIANTPSGYFISYIDYVPDPVVGTGSVTSAAIDIIITYRKCTGGGGGAS
ncbi:hypothetical protein [Fluviicola sp.]|uniref:hypothetical protein n=1 Tax=Fluviicola sp. TaxID=1917219 RepID=UPI0031D01385